MTLRRNRQLALAYEAVSGTAETLVAADVMECFELTRSHNIGRVERKPHSNTLSPRKSLTGLKRGTRSAQVEVRGTGTATDVPDFLKILHLGGNRLEYLHSIAIGTITSGPFTHGETVTGGTSSATGRVIADTADGASVLRFVPTSGTFQAAETITGGTSGASATSSGTPSHAGVLARPFSAKNIDSIAIGAVTSGPFEPGERVEGGTSGAFGRVLRQCENGAAALLVETLSGTFQNGETITGEDSSASATSSAGPATTYLYAPVNGTCALLDGSRRHQLYGGIARPRLQFRNGEQGFVVFDLEGVEGAIADQSRFSGATINTTQPPMFNGNGLVLDSYTPLFSSLDIDLGVEASILEDAANSDGLAYGVVTDRSPTFSIDPLSVSEATQSFFGDWYGDTTRVLDFEVSRGGAGNRVRFYAPAAQNSDIGDAEREGVGVDQVQGMLTDSTDSDKEWELWSY